MNMDLEQKARDVAQMWIDEPAIDSETKNTVAVLLADPNPKLLIDSFYKNLEFGTGGLRGIMGVGANCINKYTIGSATQGLSNYLTKTLSGEEIKVVVGYDSRNNSKAIAEVTANVFSANGFTVYLFPELRPTPLLSFAIRYFKCHSGVVITASHNPKEYNGYKAYWSDGAQLVPPHDKNVIAEVNAIKGFGQIKFEGDNSRIKTIGPEVEQAYYEAVKKLIPGKESIKAQSDIKIVYSSLHGTGITMVPECLKQIGFTNCIIVESQKEPNGGFPTVESPNPEERSAMQQALQMATDTKAEIVMATDPDTDRVGIGIQNDKGEFFLLNGNQAFALMIWFILKNLKNDPRHYIAKTIVTTELVDTIAKVLNVECVNTLTGFKYIAELIEERKKDRLFVAAGEESYGYMVGDFVRDKDAVSACAFFAAMAAVAKDQGKSLYDWLKDIYIEFGFYKEGLVNLVRKGADGAAQISTMMEQFRNNPPAEFNGEKVIRALDYKTGVEKDLLTGHKTEIRMPKSDVLQFYTEAGSKISVRPSGTEPKIKFYISVNERLPNREQFESVDKILSTRIQQIEKQLIQ